MLGVTITDDPAPDIESARFRLDRPVLVANLVSGALWLALLAFPSVFLFLIGAIYVAAGSVFLAAVYGRPVLTKKQEASAWVAPWLVAVALWASILIGISFGNNQSSYLLSLGFGVLIATPCYLAWQIAALAARHFIAWRSGRSFLPT
jgi:hypothetical protein